MGSTPLSDLRGARWTAGPFTIASVASNATSRSARVWRAPVACRVDSVQWIPTEADQTSSSAAVNVILKLEDGGTAGAGTGLLASYSPTATVASETSVSIPTTGSVTIGAGDFVSIQSASTGNGLKLFAGELFFVYEPV